MLFRPQKALEGNKECEIEENRRDVKNNHSRVVIVDILLRYGDIGIWFQVRTDPVNRVVYLTSRSQRILWLSQGICKKENDNELQSISFIKRVSPPLTCITIGARHAKIEKNSFRRLQ